jgi:hypothetical protein
MGFDFARVNVDDQQRLSDELREGDSDDQENLIETLIELLKNGAYIGLKSFKKIHTFIDNSETPLNLEMKEGLLELALNSIKMAAFQIYKKEKYSVTSYPEMLNRIENFIFSHYPDFNYQAPYPFTKEPSVEDPLILPYKLKKLYKEIRACIDIVNYPLNLLSKLPCALFSHVAGFLDVLPIPSEIRSKDSSIFYLSSNSTTIHDSPTSTSSSSSLTQASSKRHKL